MNLFFDPDADALFDFFRRGTEIHDADRDNIDLDIREGSLLDLRQADEAADQHERHQQIRCDVVPREPGDRSAH